VLGTHTAAELKAAGAIWIVPSLESVSVTLSDAGLRIQVES
jgi:hypothetical protein